MNAGKIHLRSDTKDSSFTQRNGKIQSISIFASFPLVTVSTRQCEDSQMALAHVVRCTKKRNTGLGELKSYDGQ